MSRIPVGPHEGETTALSGAALAGIQKLASRAGAKVLAAAAKVTADEG